MTSCWSKGARKHYAYYLCDTKGCPSYRKSIPRAKIEDGFEDILRGLQSAESLSNVANAMFRELWDARLENALIDQKALKTEQDKIAKQSETLLQRIIDASNDAVISAHEKKIDALERQKLLIAEKLSKAVPSPGRFERCFERAMEFRSSPWKIWSFGDLTIKKTVLRLTLSEPLTYDRIEGCRTPKTSLPFKVLGGFADPLCKLVPPHGLEPRTY
ncbi:MAG: hypothetical protein Pars92KO_33140 [Parasphingorhabdus sp.]